MGGGGAPADEGIVGPQVGSLIDGVGVGGVVVTVGGQDLIDLAHGREIGRVVIEAAQQDWRRIALERIAGDCRNLRGREQPRGAGGLAVEHDVGVTPNTSGVVEVPSKWLLVMSWLAPKVWVDGSPTPLAMTTAPLRTLPVMA